MAWSEAEPDDDPQQTMTIIPAGSVVYMPTDDHEITIKFPDAESAIIFREWLRQICIDGENDNEGD